MQYFYKKFTNYNGILQGDVFRVNNRSDSPFQIDEQFAILITADCDLANRTKNVNYLTFLPIISSTCYFEKIWIPTYFDKIRIDIDTFTFRMGKHSSCFVTIPALTTHKSVHRPIDH